VPHAHDPPEKDPASLDVLLLFPDPLDLAGALKTESCKAPRLLAHLGHESAAAFESTIRS
jgi:hypothetical protein